MYTVTRTRSNHMRLKYDRQTSGLNLRSFIFDRVSGPSDKRCRVLVPWPELELQDDVRCVSFSRRPSATKASERRKAPTEEVDQLFETTLFVCILSLVVNASPSSSHLRARERERQRRKLISFSFAPSEETLEMRRGVLPFRDD